MEANDPYRPPGARLQHAGPIGDAELTAFVGDNSAYYLARWSKLRDGGSALAGFNWAAAFFTLPWLLYRRLWIWIPAMLVLAIALGALGVLGQPAALAGTLANYVIPGLAANVILYRRAEREIRGAATSDPSLRLAELTRRGGTSELAMWLGIIAPVVIGFALMILMQAARES